MEEEKRIRNLEAKVAHIESWLQQNGGLFTKDHHSQPIQNQQSQPRDLDLTTVQSQSQSSSPSQASSALRSPSLPQSSSAGQGLKFSDNPMNFLAVISMICFVFAAAFIVKLAIDSEWLTPARQMGLAGLLGVGLIFCGFPVVRLDQYYAGILPGSGIIVLYLTTFATHNYHQLVSFEIAILLTTAISVATVLCYQKLKIQSLPLLASLGTFASPIWFSLKVGGSDFTYFYFLLASIVFSGLSIHFRTRVLILVSAFLAIGATAISGLQLKNDSMTALCLALEFLVFATATWLYSKENRQALTREESFSLLPLLMFFYATEYFFLQKVVGEAAPWISLGFSVFLIGLYFSAKTFLQNQRLESGPMVFSFAAVVFFHSFYLQILTDSLKPMIMIAIVLSGAFLKVEKVKGRLESNPFLLPIVLAAAVVLIEYYKIIGRLLEGPDLTHQIFGLVTTLSIVFLYLKNQFAKDDETLGMGLLASAHAMAIASLYRLATDYGSLAVSASWLIYAMLTIALGFQRKDAVLVKSSLVALIFAAAKALLYDVSQAPTVIRIVCLIITGAALFGCGLILKKVSSWSTQHI